MSSSRTFLVALVLSLLAGLAIADEQVDWQAITSGASDASSDSFSVSGSLGQPVVGMTGEGAVLHGYWQSFTIGNISCCRLRGDVDYSGDVPDIADLIYMVIYLFQQGPIPYCLGNADIDASGTTPDISDVMMLVAFMFQEGASLPACP